MKLPVIIVNFKLHEQATGESAVALAKIHEAVVRETGASIAIAVNAVDLRMVASSVSIPVFAQHVDPVGYGSYTGHLAPEVVREAGAFGTLLNHSEFPMEDIQLERAVERARAAGLFVVACADTPAKGVEVAKMMPDLVAVEPPELIGGDISISKGAPEVIERAISLIGGVRLLVGAGVNDREDVQIACALGAQGVLLASAVTKADDPYAVLMDLVAGLSG